MEFSLVTMDAKIGNEHSRNFRVKLLDKIDFLIHHHIVENDLCLCGSNNSRMTRDGELEPRDGGSHP